MTILSPESVHRGTVAVLGHLVAVSAVILLSALLYAAYSYVKLQKTGTSPMRQLVEELASRPACDPLTLIGMEQIEIAIMRSKDDGAFTVVCERYQPAKQFRVKKPSAGASNGD